MPTHHRHSPRRRLLPLILGLCCLALTLIPHQASAAFNFNDVDYWVNDPSVAEATSVSSAVLVINWNDGRGALAWGYRWNSSVTTLNQQTMLMAIDTADPRLAVQGAAANYITNIAFSTPGDTRSSNESVTHTPIYQGDSWFLQYNLALDSSGYALEEPYVLLSNPWGLGSNPADSLTHSPVGLADAPLVDGLWSFWFFSNWNELGTEEVAPYVPIDRPFDTPTPVAAIVPEPGLTSLFMLGLGLLLSTRRRKAVLLA